MILSELPDLVLCKIFREIGEFQSLYNISLVCKRFSQLAISDNLVRKLTLGNDDVVLGFGKVRNFREFFVRFRKITWIDASRCTSSWRGV